MKICVNNKTFYFCPTGRDSVWELLRGGGEGGGEIKNVILIASFTSILLKQEEEEIEEMEISAANSAKVTLL